MKISIITPTLNRANTIGDTIKSVLNQSYADFEHLIIDGGSTDDTSSIIDLYREEYGHRLVFSSGRDNGIFDACNKGIKIASGDVIGVLNSDDIYFDDKVLARIAKAFADDPNLMCVYGDLIFVKKDNTAVVRRTWEGSQYSFGAFREGWQPAHPTFYARKVCFDHFGLYRTEFGTSSDFELMMRFLEINNCRSLYLPFTMVKMRLGGVSTGSLIGIIKGNYNVYKSFKALGIKPKAFYFIRRLFPKGWNVIRVFFSNLGQLLWS